MIGSIKGKLTSKGPNQVLIEVHGLGYEVDIQPPRFMICLILAMRYSCSLICKFVRMPIYSMVL